MYAGPIQAFPLGDLFDMQVQLRMGQANVRRWVDVGMFSEYTGQK